MMAPMDDAAWDRCRQCLGLLDALDVEGRAALACAECGYASEAVDVPPVAHAASSSASSFRGF